MTATRLSLLALLLFSPAAGCVSPVVGAECAEDLTVCGQSCVDLDEDPMNCGACGNVCEGACIRGVCSRGGGSDDDVDPGAGPDAGPLDGDPIDEPVLGCDLGELSCGGSCVDPQTDPEHCGGCETDCGSGVCSSGSCSPICEAPADLCGELCVDTTSHPDHCGGCEVSCESGLCQEGICQSASAGHVVVIGHDYRQRRTGMSRLVGNAVFLSLSEPVRVASFSGDAHPASVAGTRGAINQVAKETGAYWLEEEVEDPDEVSLALAEADVFLVYAQSGATDEELAELGQTWHSALPSFTAAGGIAIVLDGGGAHSGTHQVLEPSGLFDAGGRTEVTGETLSVVDPSDSVTVGVPLDYLAEDSSTALQTEAEAVVESENGAVVVHRVLH